MRPWQGYVYGGIVEAVLQETGETWEMVGRYKGSIGQLGLWSFLAILAAMGCVQLGLKTLRPFEGWFTVSMLLGVVGLANVSVLGLGYGWLTWRSLRRKGEVAFRLIGTRTGLTWGLHGTEVAVAFRELQSVEWHSAYCLGEMPIEARVTLHLRDGRIVSPPGDPAMIFHFLRKHFRGSMRHDDKEVVPPSPPAAGSGHVSQARCLKGGRQRLKRISGQARCS
jgi:hypothetical protein